MFVYLKFTMMQLTTTNIMNNRIQNAKSKLAQHRNMGAKSSLSIFEVANLMDTINKIENLGKDESRSLFFAWN